VTEIFQLQKIRLGWMGQVLAKGWPTVKGEGADFSVSRLSQFPMSEALMKYDDSAVDRAKRLKRRFISEFIEYLIYLPG
jgi:hypothetical protein